MMDDLARTYPRTLDLGDATIDIRYMRPGDENAVMAFARGLPAHDLLFLPRDITHPKVLAAWTREIERGAMTTLLALDGANVVGCATIAREPLSWSAHVGELRVVVAASMRGRKLGRVLSQDCFAIAVTMGIEKMTAQMTVDQSGAIAVFESMGYRAEALLRDHVKDRDGVTHDIAILSHDVARVASRLDAYGLGETLQP
jgi:N-acetylglutamate synthase-like GNAT family acetyltransferase